MWILGINVGHNGSVALYNDANLVFFVEEERLTKLKYDGHPIIGIETAYKYTDHIDMLLVCHTRNHFSLYGTYNDVYRKSIKKKQPYHDFKYIELGDDHHLMHAACAFYNSNFDSAAALIVDGSGSNAYSSVINTTFNQHLLTKMRTGGHTEEEKFMKFIDSDTWEVESIWSLDYPANVQRHYASYGTNKLKDSMHYAKDGAIIEISRAHGIVKSYEAITTFLGFHEIDAGKTMGLSSYGKFNPYIAICDGRLNNLDFIIPGFPSGNKVNVDANPQVRECFKNLSDWHTDPKLVGEYRKDLAYAVQKSSENRIIDLIEKTLELTKKNKIVMAGGYGLNCVANYRFLKRFPNIKFYHEPISHDGGQSMGACQLYYRKTTGDTIKTPLKSLYTGPDISIDYVNVDYTGFNLSDSTSKDIAELIAKENIVALYQGRSESGPRALGNRSILFDPTVKDGKDLVNRVKKREWFRPFAGSCLAEYVHDWFDMAGLVESPFMMYAVEVLEDKKDIIPSITHVDGTCRIQTVTSEQNPHYYELISEFNKLKNVPILFNTSFNLAGDPLVETMDDALFTLRHSDIKYLWLPEIKKLVTKI
jgi:carbamoyltransferase